MLRLREETPLTEIVLQAASGIKLFEDGSPPQIHGKTTTLLMNPATRGQRLGSFKDKLSQNGNHLARILSYGSTGNVSRCSAVTPSQRLIVNTFYSRGREECLLVH
jgi:hypothetical protein